MDSVIVPLPMAIDIVSIGSYGPNPIEDRSPQL